MCVCFIPPPPLKLGQPSRCHLPTQSELHPSHLWLYLIGRVSRAEETESSSHTGNVQRRSVMLSENVSEIEGKQKKKGGSFFTVHTYQF